MKFLRTVAVISSALSVLTASAAKSRPAGLLGTDDNPLVTLYAEGWGVWDRGLRGSNIDRLYVNRGFPFRKIAINHAFSVPDANDCYLRTTDVEADFQKTDDGYGYPGWNGPWNGPEVAGLLGSLMTLKQSHPEMILLPSVGGWSRSQTFHACIQEGKREAFVDSIIRHVKYLGFDGVDLDWEYPSCEGGCGCQGESVCSSTSNVAAHGDWETYKSFLTYLRQRLDAASDEVGKYLYITMALGMNPDLLQGQGKWDVPTPFDFLCADDSPVDWMNMMSYDYFGPWAALTGPAAPLADNPNVSEDDTFNVKYGLDYIKQHCTNMNKLTIGLATYGKAWKQVPKQGNPPGLWQTSTATASWGDVKYGATGTYESGTVSIWDIVKNWRPVCTEGWDSVGKTATLFCDKSPKGDANAFLAYENGEVWKAKMAMARAYGMSGAIIWAASDMTSPDLTTDTTSELFAGLVSGWTGKDYTPPPMAGYSSITKIKQWANFPCPALKEGTNGCTNLSAPTLTFPSDDSVKLAGSSGYPGAIPDGGSSGSNSNGSTDNGGSTNTGNGGSTGNGSPGVNNGGSSNNGSSPGGSSDVATACKSIIYSENSSYTSDCQSKCTYYSSTGACHCTSTATGSDLASCISGIHTYCKVKASGAITNPNVSNSSNTLPNSGSGTSNSGNAISSGNTSNTSSDTGSSASGTGGDAATGCAELVVGTADTWDDYCKGMCASYAPNGALTQWCVGATTASDVANCVAREQAAACKLA